MSSTISLHFEKHKTGSVGLKRHNERIPGQRHSNQNIKADKTKDNIFLAGDRSLSYNQRINQIIQNNVSSSRQIRKDAVKLVTTTVQIGGLDVINASESKKVELLKSAYEILKNDFGEDNIVSAVIHVDESTPHLHFDFVPIKDGSLSARSLIGSRQDLKMRHQQFLKNIQNKHPEMNFKRKDNQDLNGLEQTIFEKMTKQTDEYLQSKLDKISKIDSKVKNKLSELNERELGVQTREKELDVRETSLNASKDKLKNEVDKFNNYQKSRIKKLNDKETALNQRSDELDKKAVNLDKVKDTLNQREIELNQYQERLNEKEKENEEKQKELEQRELQIKQEQEERQKELERREETVTERERELEVFESDVESRVSALVSDFNQQLSDEKLTLESISQFEQAVKGIKLNDKQSGNSLER